MILIYCESINNKSVQYYEVTIDPKREMDKKKYGYKMLDDIPCIGGLYYE